MAGEEETVKKSTDHLTPAAGLAAPKSVHGSKSNLAGASPRGSKSDIAHASSRHGSIRNLAAKQLSQPPPAETPASNPIMYENTFRMKPDKKFMSEPVKRVVNEILNTKLAKVTYDPEKAADLAKSISNDILQAVKKFEFDRYKYVVDVTIGEFKGQGIRVASRCVWDTTTDSYSSAFYRNATLFAVAIVFGGFQE